MGVNRVNEINWVIGVNLVIGVNGVIGVIVIMRVIGVNSVIWVNGVIKVNGLIRANGTNQNESHEMIINGFQVRKINKIRNVNFGLRYGKPSSALRTKLGCLPS